MKVVFISNYFNHHQSAFAEAMDRETNGNFVFIQTIPMDTERKNMGWNIDKMPSYVKKIYESDMVRKECEELILSADVVIIGSAPNSLISNRIKQHKLVFRYSERIYKKKWQILQLPLRAIKYHFENRFSRKIYMLAASAYAAADYAKTGNYIGKCYKWGYFPKTVTYNMDSLISKKIPNSILWAGRFIDWKHPEVCIEIAKRLVQEGYRFNMNIIGTGVLEKEIEKRIKENSLQNYVHILGAMKPGQVRKYMENSEIFIFTSDFQEGWGAVLNESLNSGCAVVVSHAVGAAPYLIDDGQNGMLYENGNLDEAFEKVKWLLDKKQERIKIQNKAYLTIKNEWNADEAAKRLIFLSQKLLAGKTEKKFFEHGPCSNSLSLKNGWYHTDRGKQHNEDS